MVISSLALRQHRRWRLVRRQSAAVEGRTQSPASALRPGRRGRDIFMMKVPGGTPERTLGPKRRLKCATVPAAKTETSEARPTGTKSAVPIHARGREVPIGPRNARGRRHQAISLSFVNEYIPQNE